MKSYVLFTLSALSALILASCSTSKVSSADLKAPFIDHHAEIEACYGRVLKKEPDLGSGLLELKFLINEEGQAYKTVYLKKRSTINSKLLNACIKRTVATWQFPKGQKLEVIYPFNFEQESATGSTESKATGKDAKANESLDVIDTTPEEGGDQEETPAE